MASRNNGTPPTTTTMTSSSTSSLPRMDLKPTTAKMLRTVKPFRIAGILIDLFTRIGQRDPPSPSTPPQMTTTTTDTTTTTTAAAASNNNNKKTQHVRFISIAVSNYVEKVRWGLDLLEANDKSPIFYTEDLHPPLFASFQSVPASNDQASQSPMVILDTNDDGGSSGGGSGSGGSGTKAIWGSDAILQELCSSDDETGINLYPKPIEKEIKAMEAELGERLGATARCFGYSCLLLQDDQSTTTKTKKDYEAASKFLTLHCPTIEQKLFSKMLGKGLAKGMIRAMKVKEYGTISEQEIRKVFDEMSQKLEANGGEYLMGKEYGFTAADLTLSALSYFLLRPPETSMLLLDEIESPMQLLALGIDLRKTIAGQHVLRMYEEHRPINPITKQIELKTVNQNRFPWQEIAGAATILGGAAVAYGLSR